jgi:hypothetical protein
MSLKTLLAVGESILAARNDPSPYEIRKGCQLPVFGAQLSSSLPEAAAPVPPLPEPQKEIDFEERRESRVKITPERRSIETEPQERRRLLDRKRRGSAKDLTQPELRLDQIKPVRNDLSDADLELAPRRAARSAETEINPFAPRPIAAMGRPAHEKQGWAARMARLLGLRRRGRP